MNKLLKTTIIISAALLTACATNIKPSQTSNPAPLEKFSTFDRFEIKPITMAATYANQPANEKAAAKIQEYFDERVKTVVSSWNSKSSSSTRTLVIEPRIEHIKFIAIGARIFAGPFAGSSVVVMKVKYTDKNTGRVIAEPEFYQRAAAMSGAFTVGGQDNAMLARIATLIASYNTKNYIERVGGESGATAEEVASN